MSRAAERAAWTAAITGEAHPSVGESSLAAQLHQRGIGFIAQFHPPDCPRKWRWDFCVPGFRILIEVNGSIWRKGAHNTGHGLERDYRKANWATIGGWRCLSYSTGMVDSGEAIEDVLLAIGSTEPV